ncbi:hypothetical protein K1719_005488 [Acacia pycnantha]|nr:hypothetical protein K1719_005488 [Acacia pycnantha]
MGSRERHEATKSRSTAALLQERFRELQRKKQMREERQLPKILNPSNVKTREASSSFVNNNPSSSLRSPPHVSLTLWPASSSEDKPEFHTSFGTSSSSLANMMSSSNSEASSVYDCGGSDSGVDTSLHL